jgi:hypothetical protein
MHARVSMTHPVGLLLAAALVSCQPATAGKGNSPAGQSVEVTINPPSVSLTAGGGTSFAAQVTGTANTAVTWSITEGAAGGAITSGGAYTSPATAGTFHVVATSQVDAAASATATVTVTLAAPVTVTLNPPSASLDACRTVTFTATVTGNSDTRVTWSVTEGASGGSVSTGGVYTAPNAIGTFHVVATSRADPTKSQTAAVTVGAERILTVTVSPPQVTLPTSGTTQFTATVQTTCGSYQKLAALAADGSISPQ